MKSWTWLMLPLLFGACSDDTTKTSPDTTRPGDRGPTVDRASAGDNKIVNDAIPGEKILAADKSASDGAPAGCAASYAGCSSYQDATGGNPTITFGGANVYAPNCVKVKVGQSVTFSGSFAVHPLAQAPCAPGPAITSTTTGTTATFNFSKAGVYGYYCTVHGTAQGTGMAGAVWVVP